MGSMLKNLGRAVWAYVGNWKNLLTHTLIGVGIIAIAVFMPVRPIIRVAILVLVVSANVLRMRLERRAKAARETAEE
jgi:hypothetical protein